MSNYQCPLPLTILRGINVEITPKEYTGYAKK